MMKIIFQSSFFYGGSPLRLGSESLARKRPIIIFEDIEYVKKNKPWSIYL